MATRWQQLGAFVNNIDGVTDQHMIDFARIGGKWIVPLLVQLGYSDDHDPSCVNNMNGLEAFKARCEHFGISCGGWFNGWAGGEQGTSAAQDAEKVASIVRAHNLGPIVLDLEAAYQHPGGSPGELPKLIYELRSRIKTREIAVSTNSPNDSMMWNGHAVYPDYRASMRRLNIKLLPQWYNSPNYGQGVWMTPHQTMQWIQAHGMEDNWFDPTYINERAIPMSFVHGTLEVTGLEGSDLAGEIDSLKQAKQFGYSFGFSVYVLEKMPYEDFQKIEQQKGKLYLV